MATAAHMPPHDATCPVRNPPSAPPRVGLMCVCGGGQTEDTLVHLQWYERDAAGGRKEAPEDDAIVFPDEAKAEQVADMQPGDRKSVV